MKAKKLLLSAYIFIYGAFASMYDVSASGGDIGSSKIVTGTNNLIKDVTTILMVASIPITVALICYFSIRKGGADEQDQKMWHKRINTALICGIVVLASSSIVNVIAGYYK